MGWLLLIAAMPEFLQLAKVTVQDDCAGTVIGATGSVIQAPCKPKSDTDTDISISAAERPVLSMVTSAQYRCVARSLQSTQSANTRGSTTI